MYIRIVILYAEILLIFHCAYSKALAAGSLALARAHAVLDKTEKSLEEEIAKENRKPPSNCLGRSGALLY